MTGRNANLRENESVSFKCWKEFSAFVLAKVDKTRMNNHIPNTILGLSLFFPVSSFAYFQYYTEIKENPL